MYVTHSIYSPGMVNIELKSNTAYGNVVFQSSETLDFTYEPIETYESIGGHNEEACGDTYDYHIGSHNMTEQVIGGDTSNQSNQPPVSHGETDSIYI